MGGAWRTIAVALSADTGRYTAGLAQASAATRRFGSDVDSTAKRTEGRWSTLGSKIGGGLKVGMAAGVVGVAAFGVASVAAAAKFEKGMSAIGAVSGASAAQLDTLRDKAMQLGADTSFSATEAAGAMEELVKAGLSVDEVLNGAADATVNLAAAGEVDLKQAATIASNAMNQFGLSAEKLPKVADLIAGAANASAIDIGQFGMSLAQSGAAANLAGISFDDLSVAIALMGNAGIVGSDAGTSLKTMFMRLTPQTVKQRDAMSDLGLITEDGSNRFYDAQGNVKSLADVAGILQGSLKGLTAEQKQQALTTIFGSDAIRAAAVIAGEGKAGFEGLAESMGKVTAADVAKERMDNLAGSLDRLGGAVEQLMIKSGSGFTQAIRGIVDGATAAVNFLADPPTGFSDFLDDVRAKAAPIFSDIAGAATNLWNVLVTGAEAARPFAEAVAKIGGAAVIGGISGIASALEATTGFLAENDGLVRGLTGALIALAAVKAFNALASNAQAFVFIARNAFDAIKGAGGQAAFDRLQLLAGGFRSLATDATSGVSQIKGAFSGLGSALASAGPQIAVAALAGGIYLITSSLQKAEQKAKEWRTEVEKDLDISNLATYQQAIDTTFDSMLTSWDKVKVQSEGNYFEKMGYGAKLLAETFSPMPDLIAENNAQLEEEVRLWMRLREVSEKAGKIYSDLGAQFGVSASAVADLVGKLGLTEEELMSSKGVGKLRDELRDVTNQTPQMAAVAESFTTIADETASATDKLKAYKDGLDAIFGGTMSLFDANTQYGESIASLTEALYGNGLTLDANTEAGRANREALSSAADAALELGKAVAAEEGPAAATARLQSMREELVGVATQFTGSREAAEAFVDSIGLTPERIESTVALTGAEEANAALGDLNAKLDVFNGKVSTGQADLWTEPAKGKLGTLQTDLFGYVTSNPTTAAQLATAQPEERSMILMGIVARYAEQNPEAVALLNTMQPDQAAAFVQDLLAKINLSRPVAKAGLDPAAFNAVAADLSAKMMTFGQQRPQATALLNDADPNVRLNALYGMLAEYARQNPEARAALDSMSAEQRLDFINGMLGEYGGKTVTAKALADTWEAETSLNYAARDRIVQYRSQYQSAPGMLGLGGSALASQLKRWGGITSYARGGIRAHVAKGEMIRYAEPETGGEAYIPRRGDRARSLAVLAEAAQWLGVDVGRRMATGGVTAGPVPGKVTASPVAGMSMPGVSADQVLPAGEARTVEQRFAAIGSAAERTAQTMQATSGQSLDAVWSQVEALGGLRREHDVTEAEVQAWYGANTVAVRAFAEGVRGAVVSGYDPALIAATLQAGPAQAAPVLQGTLADHAARLAWLSATGQQEVTGLSTDTVGALQAMRLYSGAESQAMVGEQAGLFAMLAATGQTSASELTAGTTGSYRMMRGATTAESQAMADEQAFLLGGLAATGQTRLSELAGGAAGSYRMMRTATSTEGQGMVLDLAGAMGSAETVGRQGAEGTANAIVAALAGGAAEVSRVAGDYTRNLAGPLNQVLSSVGKPPIRFAGGGLAVFAEGGVERHVAQIAPGAGPVRVWAEPETGGEAYIPLAPSKRPRSRSIAEETVARLGGGVQWFHSGGLSKDALRYKKRAVWSPELSEEDRGWNWRTMGNRRAGTAIAKAFPNGLIGDLDQSGRISDKEWWSWNVFGDQMRRDSKNTMRYLRGYAAGGLREGERGWNWQRSSRPVTEAIRKAFPTGLVGDLNGDDWISDQEWWDWNLYGDRARRNPTATRRYLSSMAGRRRLGPDDRGWNWRASGVPTSEAIRGAFPNGLIGDLDQSGRISDKEWWSWAVFRNAVADNEDRTLEFLRAVRHFAAGDVIGDTRGLNPEFMRRLGMWSAAVGEAYNVDSGYRSIDEQRVLYGRWLAKVPGQAQAAPPGRSMHNFGLASDGPYWRARNPGAFGLRYPMDVEPWHVEPIEAKKMRGGAAPDAGFAAAAPLPQPPPVTGLGQVGDVGAAAMDYTYRSALDWAGSQTFGAAPAMGSVLGGGVAAGGRGDLSADEAWIIGKESSGRTTARNPTSTAFGLGQLILANRRTYGSRIGVDPWTTDYGAQLSMMRMYIGERYGNATKARRFWEANNYYAEGGMNVASYDNGGWLQPGWTAAFNGTGRSERVIDDGGPSTSVIHNFAPNFAPQVIVHAGPGDDGKAIADLVVKAIDRNYSKFAAVVQRRERETA